jgi:hypothetical protein
VVEPIGRPRLAPEERIRTLARIYREIEERYAEIEALSRREHDLLSAGAPIGEVHEILHRKRELMGRIRADEEGASEHRAWWSRVKRELPADATRELLSVLDEVSRRIERSLALEAECRALLERAMAFRAGPLRTAASARLTAAGAYGSDRSGGSR